MGNPKTPHTSKLSSASGETEICGDPIVPLKSLSRSRGYQYHFISDQSVSRNLGTLQKIISVGQSGTDGAVFEIAIDHGIRKVAGARRTERLRTVPLIQAIARESSER
jgi:hypothetical protein